MAKTAEVSQFLARDEMRVDRDRLIREAKAGMFVPTLQRELALLGGDFTPGQVSTWSKSVRHRIGIEAEKINLLAEDYEGVEPGQMLRMMSILMQNSLFQLLDEFGKRSLSENDERPISTRDLGTIISNFSSRIIAASSEGHKVQNQVDYVNTVHAVLEEIRIEAELTYGKRSPESLPIINAIVEQVLTRLEIK